jgi:cell division transport system permease protein
LLSGGLLILTSVFMVAYTIRLTILGRQAELELLKLVGATNNYIRMPFLIEGLLQGFIGSLMGLTSLFVLFNWVKIKFTGSGILNIFEFAFFQVPTIATIVLVSIMLCTIGSFTSMQKFLRI